MLFSVHNTFPQGTGNWYSGVVLQQGTNNAAKPDIWARGDTAGKRYQKTMVGNLWSLKDVWVATNLIWHSHVYYYFSPVKIPEASGLGNLTRSGVNNLLLVLLVFGNWWKLQEAGARYKIQTYLVKRYKEQSYVCYNPGWMVCCAETQWVSTTVQTVGIAWYGITWYGMVSTAQRGAAPSRKMPPEYSCDNSSCECSCHLPKKEDKSQRFQKLRFSSIFFFFFRNF